MKFFRKSLNLFKLPSRSYYYTIPTKLAPARLIHEDDTIFLQKKSKDIDDLWINYLTLEPRKNAKNYYEKDTGGYGPLARGITQFDSFELPKNEVELNEHLEKPTIMPAKLFMSILIRDFDKTYGTYEGLTTVFEIMTLLYEIPDDIWSAFVDCLPDKEIVEILNLKKYRYLWPSYNFAMNHPHKCIQIKRANLINSYHFLQSIWGIAQTKLLDNRFISTTADTYKNMKILIDIYIDLANGKLILEKFRQIHPLLNSFLLRKLNHLATWGEILHLIDNLEDYLLYTDKPRMNVESAISKILSTSKDPEAFRNTIQFYEHDGYALGPQLFFTNIELWRKGTSFSVENRQLLDDYLDALYKDLIQSHILTHYQGNVWKFRDIILKKISLSNTFLQLNILQQRWHRNFALIEKVKPIQLTTWQPLLQPVTINNIEIKSLHTDSQLRDHGAIMGHCVAGYTEYCLLNQSNILVLKDSENKESTLELRYKKVLDKMHFFIKQHTSYKNQFALFEHKIAAQILVEKLNSSPSLVNSKRINELPVQKKEINFQENAANIFKTYYELKLLPKPLSVSSHTDMLKIIDNFIQNHQEASALKNESTLWAP